MQTNENLKSLENKIAQLELENKNLHETVTYLTKMLYGKKSEKSKILEIDGQVCLFDEAEIECNPKIKEPTLKAAEKLIAKKYNGQRKDKLDKLPHKKIVFETSDEELICDNCGSKLVGVGEEFVRTEVQYIPAKLMVVDYFRKTYECRKCKNTENPFMMKTPTPDPVIAHSYASASSVAHVMYEKYVKAVPLYRQENDWKYLGLNLKRQTMSNWIIAAARDWLTPIVELMHDELVRGKYIHADETPVQVMNEKDRKNTSKSYMWVYGNHEYSKHPIRIFKYSPTRNGDNAKKFLNEFQGYLISDAYQGYDKVDGVTRCYCWAHLRRYFVDALPSDVKDKNSTLPAQAIKYCGRLFEIEDEIKDFPPEKRKKERVRRSKPILDAFWSWIEENKNNCIPKSKLYKAFNYALNQKEGLMNFLKDGNIPISNNLAENSIRPFTVGRRNWLFSGNPEGAQASATVYSIIETAKANNINPYDYLRYIFKYMPGSIFNQDREVLESFLPWSEDAQEFCNKSGSTLL